jgi:beta-1,4-mannosyltransferase
VVRWRPDRPTLIVSSTSWSPDEDFDILADAIERYDKLIAASRAPLDQQQSEQEDEVEEEEAGEESTLTKRSAKKSAAAASSSSASLSSSAASSSSSSSPRVSPLPRAVFLITGRGPLRSKFDARMASLPLRYCKVFTVFVSSGDYPRLLGSADLGVSLHTSSSGLDLPMKVVDMFGAALPVAAVGFACIGELVQDGVNGRIFGNKHKPDTAVVAATAAAAGDAADDDSAAPAASPAATPAAAATTAVSPSEELSLQFAELFSDFPSSDSPASTSELARLRAGAEKWRAVSWQHDWDRACRPLLTPQSLKRVQEERTSLFLRCISILLIIIGFLMIMS